jgi:hypothetical protein
LARKLSRDELIARAGLRRRYEEANVGTLHTYMMILGDGFAAKINLLSQLLGGVHHLSVGSHKERLLATTVRQFLPKRFDVGTGFVLFPLEGDYIDGDEAILSVSDHAMSGQMDLIVYDSHAYPTIFQDGDFVIVRPEAVRSLIEVKGFLKPADIADTLGKFTDFGEKWVDCRACYARHDIPLTHEPGLFAMCWDVYVPEAGLPASDGPALRSAIAGYYRGLPEVVEAPDSRPLLDAAYLYNDSIVAADRDLGGAGTLTVQYGYRWHHGTFRAGRKGDKTVADLLERVQASLGDRINPALSVALGNQELEEEVPDEDVRHGFEVYSERPPEA